MENNLSNLPPKIAKSSMFGKSCHHFHKRFFSTITTTKDFSPLIFVMVMSKRQLSHCSKETIKFIFFCYLLFKNIPMDRWYLQVQPVCQAVIDLIFFFYWPLLPLHLVVLGIFPSLAWEIWGCILHANCTHFIFIFHTTDMMCCTCLQVCLCFVVFIIHLSVMLLILLFHSNTKFRRVARQTSTAVILFQPYWKRRHPAIG